MTGRYDNLITNKGPKLPGFEEAEESAVRKDPKRHWTHYARGLKKQRGVMNATEKLFEAEVLQTRKLAGKVLQWWYERVSFKLTEQTPEGKPGIRYTPDFAVLLTTYEMVFFEIKGGFATTKDINRLKLAADTLPFRFFLASKQPKKSGGGFRIEEY